MDILSNCRVYPVSKFYHPVSQFLNYDGGGNIRFFHLIEHDFRLSAYKRELIQQSIVSSNNHQAILIIDIISVWKSFIQEEKVNGGGPVFYMNSSSMLTIDGLINFLLQLNESPKEALKRCMNYQDKYLHCQLAGIVIDNVSYLQWSNINSLTKFNLLFKILNILRSNFGCWIISISYGLEFYNGIENKGSFTSNTSMKLNYPTYIPINYLNEMDAIVLRETDFKSRRLK